MSESGDAQREFGRETKTIIRELHVCAEVTPKTPEGRSGEWLVEIWRKNVA